MKKFLCLVLVLVLGLCSVQTVNASVRISKANVTMYRGEKMTLKVSGCKGKDVEWSSSNRKVCSVTDKGYVRVKSAGVAKIKAKVGKSVVHCTITVKLKFRPSVARHYIDMEMERTETGSILVRYINNNDVPVSLNTKAYFIYEEAYVGSDVCRINCIMPDSEVVCEYYPYDTYGGIVKAFDAYDVSFEVSEVVGGS